MKKEEGRSRIEDERRRARNISGNVFTQPRPIPELREKKKGRGDGGDSGYVSRKEGRGKTE